MKKIYIFVMLFILSFSLIACGAKMSSSQLTTNTINAWDNSAQKMAEEQIMLKNISVGGVLKIKNVIVDINRTINNKKLVLNLQTRNMSVEIEDNAKDIIDLVLGYLNLQGNLKVKHLEEAFSKIGIKINLVFENNKITGEMEVLNVVNMFKDNMSKSHKIPINQTIDDKAEWYAVVDSLLKEHIVKDFMPENINTIKTGKEYKITFNQKMLFNLYDKLMIIFGENKINNSDYTVNRIVYDAFGGKSGAEVLKDRIIFENPTARYETSALGEKGDKKYISNMKIKSKIKVKVEKKQLETLFKDISIANDNENILKIYKALESLMKYDKDLISGDVEIICNNKIVK